MKKVIYAFWALIVIVLISGCGEEKAVIVDETFVSDNLGRICGNYAVTTENRMDENGGLFIVYEKTADEKYKKLFETKEYGGHFLGKIIATAEDIYFVYQKSTHGFLINGYPIENSVESVQSFNNTIKEHDIYQIVDTFGIQDNYIYISYLMKSGNYREAELYYARITLDLKNYEKLNSKADVPVEFDYLGC